MSFSSLVAITCVIVIVDSPIFVVNFDAKNSTIMS